MVGSGILLTGIHSIPDPLSAASPAPCSDAFGLAINHLMFGVSRLRLVRISNQMLLFCLILPNTTTVCWSCSFCHLTVANCRRNTNKSRAMLLAPAIIWKKQKFFLSRSLIFIYFMLPQLSNWQTYRSFWFCGEGEIHLSLPLAIGIATVPITICSCESCL